jgi:tellurite resistance protein
MANPSKVADTTFGTKPDDTLAAVDVYATTDMTSTPAEKAGISKIASEAGSALTEAASDAKTVVGNKLNAASTAFSGIKKLGAEAIKKKKIDKDAAKALLNDVKAKAGGSLNDVKGKALSGLMSAVGYTGDPQALLDGKLGGATKDHLISEALGDSPKLQVLYKGVVKARNTADLSDAKGIAAAINAFSNDPNALQVLDMDSTLGSLAKLSSMAYRGMQISETVNEALDRLKNDDERAAFFRKCGLGFLVHGDHHGLDKSLMYLSGYELLAKYPDAVSRFLENFRFTPDYPRPTTALLTKLLATLTKLDPHWDGYLRNGAYVNNLEPFAKASADSIAVLSLSPTYKTPIMIAKFYPAMSMKMIAKRNYPYAAI